MTSFALPMPQDEACLDLAGDFDFVRRRVSRTLDRVDVNRLESVAPPPPDCCWVLVEIGHTLKADGTDGPDGFVWYMGLVDAPRSNPQEINLEMATLAIHLSLVQLGPKRTRLTALCLDHTLSPFLHELVNILASEFAPAGASLGHDLAATRAGPPDLTHRLRAIPSERDRQIVTLWTTGLTEGEIAHRLKLVTKTVHNRISHLRKTYPDLVPRRR